MTHVHDADSIPSSLDRCPVDHHVKKWPYVERCILLKGHDPENVHVGLSNQYWESGPAEYLGVITPEGLREMWSQTEAVWWRNGVRDALNQVKESGE